MVRLVIAERTYSLYWCVIDAAYQVMMMS